MWKCSVCGRENSRMVCRTCGQLECEDLLALRSLMPVTKDDVKTQKARIREWKQEGRGQRPVKKYLQAGLAAAAAICILVLGIRIGSAGKTPAPAPTETLPPVLEAETTEATVPETTAAETIPQDNWKNNVLMEDWHDPMYTSIGLYLVNEAVFGNKRYQREDMESITFADLSDFAQIPEGSWDVSQNQDGSVLAWVEGRKHLYIGGYGGVCAPRNCAQLFSDYDNVASIVFDGHFHTDMAESFSNLFCGDSKLVLVDLEDWNTARVTDMGWMFVSCDGLTDLDLSAWDTSQMTDMSQMFGYCDNLVKLDLSGWDTSRVTDMGYLFAGCRKLQTLDLSGWKTSAVTDMSRMFRDCKSLTKVDLSQWDTSNVTEMSEMFYFCDSLSNLALSGWDTSRVKWMNGMFYGCDYVGTFDLGTWETDTATFNYNFMDEDILVNGQPWENLFKK